MNEVIEQLQKVIRLKVERFSNLDRILLRNELIEHLEEENRLDLMQEYNISGWDDEDEQHQ